MSAEEAEAARRWPMPHPRPRNVNERRANMVYSALRQGFVEGARWERERRAVSIDLAVERAALAEEGRRLASQREDLIADGIDPSLLDVPLHPDDLS